MQEIAILAILGLICLVMGVFFILRALQRLKAWREGDRYELWAFLGLIIGAGLILILGVGLALVGTELFYAIIGSASPILIILSLVPVGLFTLYYLLKWLETK